MIEFLFKTVRDTKYTEISEPKRGCWVNSYNPSEEELNKIAKLCKLEHEDVTDSLDEFEIPRLEKHDSTIVFFLKKPNEKKDISIPDTFTIICSDDYFVTISISNSDEFVEHLKLTGTLAPTTQKAKLLLQILLKIANEFTRKVKAIRNRVASQKRLEGISNASIMALASDEDILDQYLTVLIPMRNVLEALYNGNYIVFFEEDKSLLEDMIMSIRQLVDTCNTNMKSIKNLIEAYQIVFTNNLNNEIRILTYITVTLAIPTFIAGFYGMNISLPLQNHPHAFTIVSVFTGIMIFLTMWIVIKFSRKKR
ncbi:magnesium transporter CorA family protein [candidate division WWE3 bacterium]|uniref:Magnesium transporter CorA family protein n=1 Tax=candidate division WWE3 bacterium TaxID=2053526 RepID=A0A7X9HGM9_UNCKA|nr:magnesium transporter CorA family protein [candidate division WWE3 bacterium]